MKFDVTFKGIRWFSGRLEEAYMFVEQTWGSSDKAWEMGVKLTRASNFMPHPLPGRHPVGAI